MATPLPLAARRLVLLGACLALLGGCQRVYYQDISAAQNAPDNIHARAPAAFGPRLGGYAAPAAPPVRSPIFSAGQ